MRVKRYVVDSMPDALQRIRSDLGNDAVILNTKEIRSGGFLGLFSKKKIEVIAATDTANPAPAKGALKTAGAHRGSAKSAAPAVPRQAAAKAYEKPQRPKMNAEAEVMPFVPDVLPAASSAGAAEAAAAAAEGPLPNRQAPREGGQADALREAMKPAGARPSDDSDLAGEIRQMKEMMRKLAETQAASAGLDPALARWKEGLLDQEILPEVVSGIVGSAQEELAGRPAEAAWVKETVRQQLLRLVEGRVDKQIDPSVRVVHFVGPTGVGKTTTIAKLAAEQVLKLHRKVGLITSDTYRIAAVEQLKTYATILNVPLEVVFSPQDLSKAFKNLEHCDIIFMDTAGRNFRNAMYVSELNALLQNRGDSVTFLVLGLTNKYRDMKAVIENFIKFKIDNVIFTKMDETESYGAIVNVLHEYPLRLSYITNGQNVPEDIASIEEERLVDWITEAIPDE